MDTKLILTFLSKLNKNNSLEWMKNNKQKYEQAKHEFENILFEFINQINIFDNSIKKTDPKDLLFRLNRDTRFSNDKSPYNPSFRAHISKNGKLPVPVGYYISIKPGNIFLGGGLFTSMFADATKSMREYIIKNGKQFENIIEKEYFKNNFIIEGEKLKNVPKEYDKDYKFSEYLKNKSWYIEYHIDDSLFLKPETFISKSVEIFKNIKPFNDYINKALKYFKMPERK
jgi:uncharacterized protein (TIGR02453 family)